jgi:hypothetical protein
LIRGSNNNVTVATAGNASRSEHLIAMRIRMLGHNFPISMVVLSAVEALVFFGAVYAAALARFGVDFISVDALADMRGALWPRALLFSAVMMLCFLAFGL